LFYKVAFVENKKPMTDIDGSAQHFLLKNEFTKKSLIIHYKDLTKLETKESGYLPIFQVFCANHT